MPTNDHDLNQPGAHDPHARDSDHPGYEVTDVNAGGVAVFLASKASDFVTGTFIPVDGGYSVQV